MNSLFPRQRGITYIEICGVLIAVLLLAALAHSSMSDYLYTLKQKGAVTSLKRLLQTARSRAVANPAVHCGVYFDAANNPQQVLMFYDTYSPGTYAYDIGKDKLYLSSYTIPKGITMSIPQPYPAAIVFRGDGSAYLSGMAVLKGDNFTDTVDVLASTGRIKATR